MNRSQSDQWSLGLAPTPSITSSFTMSLEKGHSKTIGAGTLYSVKCGLGWRFGIIATKADTELGDETSGNVLITVQKTQFELIFDPHSTNNTNLSSLTITTTVERMVPQPIDASPSKTVSLPTQTRPHISLGRFDSEENYTGNVTVTFQVDLPTSFNFSLPVGVPSPKIQRALGDSLMGHELIDTKFLLFTHRTRDHQPSKPRAVFGNSHLLHGFSSYLDTLLDGNGYKESTEVDLGSDLFDDVPVDGYDYISDSDLDSDSEDEYPPDPMPPRATPSPPLTLWGSLPISAPSLTPPPVPVTPQTFSPAPPPETPPEDTDERPRKESGANILPTDNVGALPQASPHTRKLGRRIIIHDTALRTWKSLLFYFYTGKLDFSPLGRRGWPKGPVSTDSLKCSPKSMFRLADKIDLPEVQQLALDAIRRSLTKDNILDQLFSRFTSMYPQVQKIEIDFLTANLTTDLFRRFKQKLKLVVAGELPHSFDVLSDLIQKMCDGGVRISPHHSGAARKGKTAGRGGR